MSADARQRLADAASAAVQQGRPIVLLDPAGIEVLDSGLRWIDTDALRQLDADAAAETSARLDDEVAKLTDAVRSVGLDPEAPEWAWLRRADEPAAEAG